MCVMMFVGSLVAWQAPPDITIVNVEGVPQCWLLEEDLYLGPGVGFLSLGIVAVTDMKGVWVPEGPPKGTNETAACNDNNRVGPLLIDIKSLPGEEEAGGSSCTNVLYNTGVPNAVPGLFLPLVMLTPFCSNKILSYVSMSGSTTKIYFEQNAVN